MDPYIEHDQVAKDSDWRGEGGIDNRSGEIHDVQAAQGFLHLGQRHQALRGGNTIFQTSKQGKPSASGAFSKRKFREGWENEGQG